MQWLRYCAARAVVGALAAVVASICAVPALAAPEEIVVFTDEFEKPGETAYELHFNYAARARRIADYPGEQPPAKVLRFMPEAVWGLSERWNLGLHLPMSRNDLGTTSIDGFKARLQYLNSLPRDDGNVFYGANYELSYFRPRLSDSRLVAEVRGIVGRRKGDWLMALNPILSYPLAALPEVEKRVDLDLFAKLMKTVAHDVAVGVEHYASFGALSQPKFGPASDQISYAVLEFATRSGFEIHAAVGRGWTTASDKLVYKLLVGLPF